MTTDVPRNWLLSIVGVEDIDAWQAALAKPGMKPRDLVQTEWQMLKAKMLPGDEIWYFPATPKAGGSWRAARVTRWCATAMLSTPSSQG